MDKLQAPKKLKLKRAITKAKLDAIKKRLFCNEVLDGITVEEINNDFEKATRPSSPIGFQNLYYMGYKLPDCTLYCQACIIILIKQGCPEKNATQIQEDTDLYSLHFPLTPTQLNLLKRANEDKCTLCKSSLVFYERRRDTDVTELYQAA